MKKYYLILAMILSLGSYSITATAAPVEPAISETEAVTSIMARTSGYNAIFLDGTVPDQGCTHTNPSLAIIVGTDTQLIELATAAVVNSNPVALKVDGCSLVNAGTTLTAPRVVRVHMFAQEL